MQEFIEIPASKLSLAMRKPVHGIGVNDANYIVTQRAGGKRLMCPFYLVWANMIERCYCEKLQDRNPTYKGCSVVDGWLIFSVFREWMKAQDFKGKELDKDILISGNKVYSPEACLFVSHSINTLLIDCAATRGGLPQGVCFNKAMGSYQAQCRASGKSKHLGHFRNVRAAECAYLIFKSDLIKKVAFNKESASNPKLQEALLIHSDIFKRKADEVAA